MPTNMYEWITAKNINPLAGRCPHECKYCYALNDPKPGMKAKYSGIPRIQHSVLKQSIVGGVRFLCSCNDLFAVGVPHVDIYKIIDWSQFQKTTWAIQTKNPNHPIFRELIVTKPSNFILGTTIETNRDIPISKAPPPSKRIVRGLDYATIEPIMDFDLEPFVAMIKEINPKFVNIGADSGNNDLPEPSAEKVRQLISELEKFTEVRVKHNLGRLVGDSV